MRVALVMSVTASTPEWLGIVLAILLVIWIVLTWISTSGRRWR